MVKASAFEDSTAAYWVRDCDAAIGDLDVLRRLQGHGLVRAGQPVGGAVPWRFTKHGLTQIITERGLEPRGAVTDVDP
eukprot:3471869-Alexandrium_andersonii.AAC.1